MKSNGLALGMLLAQGFVSPAAGFAHGILSPEGVPRSRSLVSRDSLRTACASSCLAMRRPDPIDTPNTTQVTHTLYQCFTAAGRATVHFSRQVGDQCGKDLYQVGATLNTLSYRATTSVLSGVIKALRLMGSTGEWSAGSGRISGKNKGPSALDYCQVIVDLGIAPLAMVAVSVGYLAVLSRHAPVVATYLLPFEILKVTVQGLRNTPSGP